MVKRPIMVWNTALVWEDLTPPGLASVQWRCEIGGGFWLHVNRKLDVGATYTATVKHAGGLCASRGGFRKFSRRDTNIPLVKWAKTTAAKFTREVMERMEKTECHASPTTPSN